MKPIVSLAAALALGFGGAQLANAQAVDVPAVPGGLDSQYPAFDQVDSNSDGQISREEAEAAGLEFDWSQSDSDGTGALSQEEYDSAFGIGSSPDDGLDASPDDGSTLDDSSPDGSDSNMDSMDSPDSGNMDDGLDVEPGRAQDRPGM